MSAAGGHHGVLILVVGPSGAGKDTLIALARDLIGAQERIRFPRRIVTRESSTAEDHDVLTPEEFDDAVRRGAFAFWWQAHGHKYAIAATIDDDIRRGIAVVCNVSRAVVAQLRRTYASCKVVLVDAPREVRASRIRARGRGSDGDESLRLDRRSDPLVPDIVIMNTGDARVGAHVLARIVMEEIEKTPCLPPDRSTCRKIGTSG